MGGWAVAFILILVGRLQSNRAFLGGGMVAAGLMVLLTPLSFFLSIAVRDGAVEMESWELLILAGFAFLGALIVGLGIPYLRSMTPFGATQDPGKR